MARTRSKATAAAGVNNHLQRTTATQQRKPRTRSKATAETEGLDKYNYLLRTTTTQQEEEEVIQQNVKVRLRGSTKLFVDALEPLRPDRRIWLQDTPFRKLLDMHSDIQSNGLIKNFVTMFNTKDNSIDLEGEKHVITTQHVSDILGINDGEDEEEIKMPGKGQRVQAKSKIKRAFLGKKGICLNKVKKILRESLDIDYVKRAYILLALRFIVFTPAAHDYLPSSCLDLVADVSVLNNKRWATFVITSLVKGIEAYKNSKGDKEKSLGGCPLLLQLYATKGSITTPQKSDKRGKKRRNKDCSDSSNPKERISIERAKEIFEKHEKSHMNDIVKRQKKNLLEYRKNTLERKFVELLDTDLNNRLEERRTHFYKLFEGRQ